ncbi:Heat shock 70 kDa protein 15 [Abeliophyllum distichum]|uniref:Heat shock 70 kDa protein 15 n=1 Tax=Abeliophyllum distichum TaxID=126358 RepID=A0ABD1QUM5_9LAMI
MSVSLQLNDKYHEFVMDSEREQFIAKLQEVEDWLYEDGEDETKGVYVAKLEKLKKQGDPVEECYKEHTRRGSVIDQLVYCINSYREAVISADPKFDHNDLAEKQKPKPATLETSSPRSSQGGESQSLGADNTNSSADQPSNAGETAGNEVPPPAEPMETDKSESASGAP